MEENIRNFCIIAHVDHGKSTLADRFLELTGTVEKRKMREQFLDQMALEREKGITIKMQPVRMVYEIPKSKHLEFGNRKLGFSDSKYILNLIDTPGHVDFSYEVSRSLAAVEGAILLVDATKGVQAQTVAHLHLAQQQNISLIPAVNKIDAPLARSHQVAQELVSLLKVGEQDIFYISAKEGTNVEQLLQAVIRKVPPPHGSQNEPFRALIFDSRFDPFKGVVAYIRVVDGMISKGEEISFFSTKEETGVKEVGYFLPQETPVESLRAGEIGYIATGIKDPEKIRIGDTITTKQGFVESLPGFQIPKPMVFVSFYPQDPEEFDLLKDAVIKLRLNDPSFTWEVEAKEALGRGLRCGFLGVLHSEIIAERIRREFHIEMVISRPSVEFTIIDKTDKKIFVRTALDWPSPQVIKEIFEPWVQLKVITPSHFFGETLQLLENLGGRQCEIVYGAGDKVLLMYEVPLRGIIGNLYDKLKGMSQGLASMDYEFLGVKLGDLVKLDIRIAGKEEEALAVIVSRQDAYGEGKAMIEKLKEVLPPQLFEVALQAVAEGRVLARETIRAKRRDVTAPLYGGDVTRKRKLLEKQKKGKKELKERGQVHIPTHAFFELFRS